MLSCTLWFEESASKTIQTIAKRHVRWKHEHVSTTLQNHIAHLEAC